MVTKSTAKSIPNKILEEHPFYVNKLEILEANYIRFIYIYIYIYHRVCVYALSLDHLGHGLRPLNIERPPNMGVVRFFIFYFKIF